MPESKVVSLDERAKDEEKPFLEQLLKEGAKVIGTNLNACFLLSKLAAQSVKSSDPV